MRSGRTLIASALALLLAGLVMAPPALAQVFDARRMGMGGAALPGSGLARVNPAYRAVPEVRDRGHGKRIPLPIGIVQAINDFPETDPDNDEFNLVEIINYGLNIPYNLEIRRSDPPSGDIEFTVEQDALTVDLGEMQEYVPEDPFTIGGYGRFLDAGWGFDLGQRLGVLRLDVAQGFLQNEFELDMGDDLRRVLREAEPIVGGETYEMAADGLVQAGFSTGLTYARSIPLSPGRDYQPVEEDDAGWADDYWASQADRPRMWVGVGVRRYFGVGLAKAESDLRLTGQDPLFSDTNDFEVDYDALVTTSSPDGFDSFGQATALDLGLVYRYKRVEVGFGVADLFAQLQWDKARQERWTWDDVDGGFVETLVAEETSVTTEIPESWTANLSYNHDNLLLAADVGGGPGGESFHAGAELWATPMTAVRGGLSVDERGKLQFGWGGGVRFSRFGLDLGMATHSRNLSGIRDISVGLGLVLY